MENTNNINYWQKIKELKNSQLLTFIHIPKCGGLFIKEVLKELNINNKGHNLAEKEEGITFTVIRNPVERFESLINYRLDQSKIKPKNDWPEALRYVYKDKSISLNEIVEKMSDNDILNFRPYKTLHYWSKNIDIFITIDKLEEFLYAFGYEIDLKKYEKKNVSKKERGAFNEITKKRISNLYSDDMVLYKKVILD